jgi:hypothetical protein
MIKILGFFTPSLTGTVAKQLTAVSFHGSAKTCHQKHKQVIALKLLKADR